MPPKNLFSTDNWQSDEMQTAAEGYDPDIDFPDDGLDEEDQSPEEDE